VQIVLNDSLPVFSSGADYRASAHTDG
jgi:hypothetical protein